MFFLPLLLSLRAILDLKFPDAFSTFFFRYLSTVNELLIQVFFFFFLLQTVSNSNYFSTKHSFDDPVRISGRKANLKYSEVLFLRLLSHIRFPYFGLSQRFLKKSKDMLVSARLSLLEFVLARLCHISSPAKLHSRDRDDIHATKNRL